MRGLSSKTFFGELCFSRPTTNIILPSAEKLYGDAELISQLAHTAVTKSWLNDQSGT